MKNSAVLTGLCGLVYCLYLRFWLKLHVFSLAELYAGKYFGDFVKWLIQYGCQYPHKISLLILPL